MNSDRIPGKDNVGVTGWPLVVYVIVDAELTQVLKYASQMR